MGGTQPLFDMSKAKPIDAPLFDMSKAKPIAGQNSAPVSAGTSDQYLGSAGLPTSKDFSDFGHNLGEGFSQSAAKTVGRLAEYGARGLGANFTEAGRKAVQNIRQRTDAASASKDTLGEKIGGGAEQATEMMATGGPIKAGAETLASKLPLLGRFAAPLLRIGGEAINTGGNAALHDQPIAPSAAAGGFGATIGELLPLIAPLLKRSAATEYSQVLAPTTKANKNVTQRLVPQLLDRNEIHTASGLLSKADSNVERLGSDIDTAVKTVPSSVKPNTQNVVDHLENFKNDFRVNGVDVDPDAVNKATELQGIVKQLGPDVSYQSLNKVRQIWDAKVAKSGGYAGKTLAEGSMVDAQREGATAIRRELAKQSPDIAKINAEFSLWKGVSNVLSDTAERRAGQSGGLVKKAIPYLAGAAGVAHGGPTTQGGIEAVGAAMIMAGLNHLSESGALKTLSAVAKNQLADAIMRGDAQAFTKAVSRSAVAGSHQLSQEQNSQNSKQLQTQQ